MVSLINQIYAEISKLANDANPAISQQAVGLRGCYKTDRLEIGQILEKSYEWIDNLQTDNLLNGTCTVGICDNADAFINALSSDEDDAKKTITIAIRKVKQYGDNNTIALIAGNSLSVGNDDFNNEIVIGDAEVVALFNNA